MAESLYTNHIFNGPKKTPKSGDVKSSVSKKIGEVLVENNHISDDHLSKILELQKRNFEKTGIQLPVGLLALKTQRIEPDDFEKVLGILGIKHKLGEILLKKGVIDIDQLLEAIKIQYIHAKRGKNIPLGEILLNQGYINPKDLADAIHDQKGDHFLEMSMSEDDFQKLFGSHIQQASPEEDSKDIWKYEKHK